MTTKYAVNYKTKEIIEYNIYNNSDTDFPRGDWLVDRDFILTGIETKENAEKYLKEDPFNMSVAK